MSTKTEATIEDLYRYDGRAELVNGEIVPMSPNNYGHGYAGMRISQSLLAYEEQTHLGVSVPEGVGFVVNLPNRRSFSPDAAFYVGEPVVTLLIQDAPTFAVEVRSDSDYGASAERLITAKRHDYFRAGTLVVWDVDLHSDERVRVYRAGEPDTPTIYRPGDMAEAEPAVPGWRMPIDNLFPKRFIKQGE